MATATAANMKIGHILHPQNCWKSDKAAIQLMDFTLA